MPEFNELKRPQESLQETSEERPTKLAKTEVESEPVPTESTKTPATIIDLNPKPTGNTESDVGITNFIYNGKGRITGNLKQRYTDFLVNEIDMDGNVVHLSDLGIPVTPKTPEEIAVEVKKAAEVKEAEEKKEFILEDEHKKQIIKFFGEEDTEKVLGLLKTGSNVETKNCFDDKEVRTKIHRLLREAFQGKLDTITTQTNSFQIGLRTRSNTRQRRRDRNLDTKQLNHKLGEQKNFLHFSVYKENKETMEIAGILAKFLSIPVKWIKYAGTKDRRGVTVQRMSVERLSVERMNNLNKGLKGCKIGGFKYENVPVNLGDLKGNEFIITIKDAQLVEPSEAGIEEAIRPLLESLGTIGFINYFGMQRFGTFSVSTHDIGREILQSNWKTAAELILSEQEICIPASVDARKIWKETKDPSATIKKMPRKCSAEYSILSRLEHSGKEPDGTFSNNSYFNALMGIPRNLRIMYGHAYQSYIWNVVASRRMDLFGLKVVAGDLVMANNEKNKEIPKPEKPMQNSEDPDDDDFKEDVKKDTFFRARPVTEEEVAANKFDIHDIVLPTPGFDVVYPENETLKQLYVDVMAKDNLDPFKMSRKVREFSLAGSYRPVVAKVENLEYYIRKYENVSDPLVRSDFEILLYKNRAEKRGEEAIELKQVLDGKPDGEKTAVIIKMQLQPSTYATMALRELIVGDTSRYGDVVSLRTKV